MTEQLKSLYQPEDTVAAVSAGEKLKEAFSEVTVSDDADDDGNDFIEGDDEDDFIEHDDEDGFVLRLIRIISLNMTMRMISMMMMMRMISLNMMMGMISNEETHDDHHHVISDHALIRCW